MRADRNMFWNSGDGRRHFSLFACQTDRHMKEDGRGRTDGPQAVQASNQQPPLAVSLSLCHHDDDDYILLDTDTAVDLEHEKRKERDNIEAPKGCEQGNEQGGEQVLGRILPVGQVG